MMRIKFSLLFYLNLIFLVFPSYGQQYNIPEAEAEHWADSVYNTLTLEEKIGQLIFVRANKPFKPYDKRIDYYIKRYNIGGVTFFGGNPLEQALQTNIWNNMAKTPLFVSIDAEWGLGMRLKGTLKYPLQMTLGAQQNDTLLYLMGKQIGEQCKRMGIQINFAPVVDVNSNPENPVIGMRSFGEDPEKVAHKAYFYIKGMQDAGIIACAKHFPGHGDTYQDSHKTLPKVTANKKEIFNTALYPYKYLFDAENPVSAVMVAHLSIPALDKRKNYPATLSYPIVTKLLKNKLDFKGLVITDALDMKGVTLHFGKDKVGLKAFEAGNDILLIPEDIPSTVESIKQKVLSNSIAEMNLEKSCKKILKYKYLTGVWKRQPVKTENLTDDLNNPRYLHLINELFSGSVTVLSNQNNIIPFAYGDTSAVAVVVVGDENTTVFEQTLKKSFNLKVFRLPHDAGRSMSENVLKQLVNYNKAVILFVNTNILSSRRFGITKEDIAFAEKAARQTNVIIDIFASPYALDFFNNINSFKAVIVSYQDKPQLQKASAEVMAGLRGTSATLPVSTENFDLESGIAIKQTRLRQGTPEEVGANVKILQKIDSIALQGIKHKAFPGCQILAAKDGIIFYDKTFGYHTYDKNIRVKKTDLYDLASLTKVLATTPALMKLVETGKIDINRKLSDYLFFLKGTNKEDLTFIRVLSHQAGLRNWIPFYEETILPDGSLNPAVFNKTITENFPVRVAQNLYIQKDYHYKIFQEIIDSEVDENPEYKYSDLGFYLFKLMIEQIENKPFDKFVYDNFYKPLGIKRLTYKPRDKFPLKSLIPTENDTLFRKQQIIGDVHDQGAAMLGGISGHAGLFGNAHDVAVMMQMFLNGGTYNGKRVLDKSTIDIFNRRYFAYDDNRRGLGFDKPLLEYEEHRTNCKSASDKSFGHSGFTGTYMWADPENGLVYVFLSNRVYPDMYNSTIMDEDIRTNIHQLFYDSLK